MTLTCAPVHLSEFVMSATTVLSRDDVSSVEVWEYRMLTIAKNAHSRRKIEMVALKLSIWVVLKQICSMNVRNMVLKNGDMVEVLSLPSNSTYYVEEANCRHDNSTCEAMFYL